MTTLTEKVPDQFYIFDNVGPTVQQGIEANQTLSLSTVEDLKDVLDQLTDALATISDFPSVAVTLGSVTSTIDPFVYPPAVQEETVSANFPTAPANPTLGTVSELFIDDVPTLDESAPEIRLIAPVTPFTKSAPTPPTLTDLQYPDTPPENLPTSPTLRVITLPTAPSLIDVQFEGVAPDTLETPPSVAFSFTDQEYQSALVDTLNSRLLSLILNLDQTSLSPPIEQQIWDNGRARTTAAMLGAQEELARLYMRSGWSMPIGPEIKIAHKAVEDKTKADVTESRSIAIAQADLEQKNLQFAFTQAISLEGILINLHNSTQQRALDAAKYAVQAAIDLYGLRVTYHNQQVILFTAYGTIYRDRIQGELAKLELFKAQLEGQKLIGELNAQDIANYQAQIEAVVSLFTLYKTKLEAVRIQLEEEGLLIQQYEALIRGFAEEIKAKSLEYEGYRTEWEGEKIRADIFDTIVESFGKRVDAWRAMIEARSIKQQADIKLAYDVPLDILEKETQAFVAAVTGESERLRALIETNKSRTEIFKSQNEAEGIRINAQVAVQEQEVKKLIADGDMQIRSADVNSRVFLAKKELVLGGLTNIARVLSQIAASFGSAVHYAAGIQSSNSTSLSVGYNAQEVISENV